MAMATLFGNIMTIEDVPGTVARAILSFSENKIVILMLINVLLLVGMLKCSYRTPAASHSRG